MRTALVTGATRNIGRALALSLAADGYSVAVNGRDPAAVEETVSEIDRRGGEALAVAADVRDPEAVAGMVGRVEDELGGVDILINNAVVRSHGSLEELSPGDWEQVLGVVLLGAAYCLRGVLPGMKSQGWGRVVNMAGVSGQKGASNRSALVAAKSGLIGLTKAAALEVAGQGITVNAVSPGLIDTERDGGLGDPAVAEEHYRTEVQQVPVGRLGRPEEVVHACRYLCSEEGGFVTGQVLGVNGGLYM